MASGTKKNLLWGTKYGLIMAIMYSAIAMAILERSRPPAGEIGRVLGLYFGGGLGSGLLLGLLRERITTRRRAMLLGVVIAFPTAFLGAVLTSPSPMPITSDDWIVALEAAVIFGLWGGWVFGPGGWAARK